MHKNMYPHVANEAAESVLQALAAAVGSRAAWWEPHAPTLRQLANAPDRSSIAAVLNGATTLGLPVHFVAASMRPANEAYESYVHRTQCVPTRDNLHDLLNGAMWLRYPLVKQRLNQLQADQIASTGAGASRGALRDALTVFDENAAILQASEGLLGALQRRDWRELFIARRDEWKDARLVLFGHALLEKLLAPRKAITAHVWTASDLSDAALATGLVPERLVAKPFLPLPVLGVPGRWSDNESADFYEDGDVFRARAAKP